MPRGFLDWSKKPDVYKKYQELIEITYLPEPSPGVLDFSCTKTIAKKLY
jgi:hypothetical protein